MNQFKYILAALPLLLLQAVWAQNRYEEYISHTDATTTWQNGHYERVARELYKMPKGYRFTANDNKSLRAHIDETLLFDADYLTAESDIPNVDEYELDQSRPVGVIPSSHGVSPTGAAMYNIPVAVAPGTSSMQPSISVNYNSQGGNGILGMGWSLNGMMAVTRCNPSIYYDGNTNDGEGSRFMLNGQRLLLWTGNKYGEPGSTYETEARSFAEIKAGNKGPHIQSFTVKTKDGMIYYYGTEDSDMDNHSKIEVTDGAPDEKVFAWLLRKVIDKNGNYITYHYHEDNLRDEFWLEEIKYTGNDFAGVEPYNSVKFFYENRKDKNTAYFLGKHEQTVLLRQVKVEAEGQLAWYYDFTYQYSSSSICSRLVQVDKKDRNGNMMNPIQIEWGEDTENCTVMDIGDINSDSSTSFAADFNGDGLMDFYTVPIYETQAEYIFIFINKGDGTFRRISHKLPTKPFRRAITGRFTTNGRDQLALVYGGIFDNTTIQIYSLLSNTATALYHEINFSLSAHASDIFTINADGDGTNEIFYRLPIQNKAGILNPSTGNIKETQSTAFRETQCMPLDFNGDGKSEIMTKYQENSIIWRINPDFSFSEIYNKGYPQLKYDYEFPGDFNGDGKTDFLTWSKDLHHPGWQLHYSNGTDFVKGTSPIDRYIDPQEDNNNNYLTGDFNGDGKTDILEYFVDWPGGNATDHINMYYSQGNTFTKENNVVNGLSGGIVEAANRICGTKGDLVADFDGDGKADILAHRASGIKDNIVSFHKKSENLLAQAITDGLETVSYDFSYPQYTYNTTIISPELTKLSRLPMVKVNQIEDNSGLTTYTFENALFHTKKGFIGCLNTGSSFVKGTLAVNSDTESELNTDFLLIQPKTLVSYINNGNSTTSTSKTISYNTKASSAVISGLDPHIYQSFAETITETIDGFTTVTIAQQTDNGNPHMIDVRKGSESGTLISRKSWTWESEPLGRLNKLKSEGEAKFADGNIAGVIKEYTYTTNDLSSVTVKTVGNDGFENGELSVEVFETDYFGNRTKTTKNGRETIYGFDQFGRWPLTVTNFKAETATFTYDPRWGAKTSETDSWGYTTQYTYTAFGTLTKKRLPSGLEVKHSSQWDINSATDGKGMFWSKTENPDGSFSQTWYDHIGREVRSSSNGLVLVDKKYSDSGTEIEQSLPYRQGGSPLWTKTTFDARNRPLSVFNGISTATYSYADGADGTTITINDSSKDYNITKKFNYLGQLESVNDLGGTIAYEYYVNGMPKSTKVHSLTTSFKYDKYGNRTEINDPSAGITTSVYNEWGDLLEQTTATGATTYTYDDLGYLQTASENGITSTYSYNSKKLVENISNSNGTSKAYSYNQWGQVLKETTTVGNRSDEHSYSYDDKGRVQIESYGNRFHLAYEYDNIGRLTSLRNNSNGKLIYQTGKQIPISNITTETRGSSQMVVKKRYDDYGRLVHIYDDQDYRVDLKYTYWNGTNNLKTFEDRRRPIGYMSYLGDSYQYANDRLTKYSSLAGTADYDEKGNMVYNPFIDAAPKETPDVFDENMHFNYLGYQQTGMNISRTDFNLPAHEVAFNEIGLVETITENAYEISFLYGSDHQRRKIDIKKNGSLFMSKYYFGSTELQIDKDGNERTIDYIGIGSGLLAMYVTHPAGEGDPEIIHCVTDRLGSPYKLFKDDGTQLAEYSYDPWGRMRKPSTLEAYKPGEITWASLEANGYPSWFHRGYTGHEMLFGVNLINMNARLYDPITCRFLSPDKYVQNGEFSQNFNRYAYCYNNPLMYTDPSGDIIGFIIAGAIIGAWIGGAESSGSYNPANWTKDDLGSIFGGAVVGAVSGTIIGAMWKAGATVTTSFNIGGLKIPGISFSKSGFETANTIFGLTGLAGAASMGGAAIDWSNVNDARDEILADQAQLNPSDWGFLSNTTYNYMPNMPQLNATNSGGPIDLQGGKVITQMVDRFGEIHRNNGVNPYSGRNYHVSDIIDAGSFPEKHWFKKIFGPMTNDGAKGTSYFGDKMALWYVVDRDFMENYNVNYIDYIYGDNPGGNMYRIRAMYNNETRISLIFYDYDLYQTMYNRIFK